MNEAGIKFGRTWIGPSSGYCGGTRTSIKNGQHTQVIFHYFLVSGLPFTQITPRELEIFFICDEIGFLTSLTFLE